MKALKRLLGPLLIIAIAVALFVYMKSTKPQQQVVEVTEKTWLVETMPANFERLAPVQVLYGVVESNQMVSAAAPLTGVVDEVQVKEGMFVAQGDALVSINPADLNIPVQQAKADKIEAQSQVQLQKMTNQANQTRLAHEKKVLKLKQKALARTKQLLNKDLASKSSLDQAEEAVVRQEFAVVGARLAFEQNTANLAQSKARLTRAQASYEKALLNQQRGQLHAPFDARIAKVNVSEGSRVNANTVMIEYYPLNSLELRAQLSTQALPSIKAALAKEVALQARFAETPKKTFNLPLLRLAGEASTSGVDVFFGMPEELYSYRPGELMEVALQGEAQANVLALPYSAIYGKNRIYTVEDNRLVSKQVQRIGEVMREDKLWALVRPGVSDIKTGAKINITHLPNAINGLKVVEGQS